MSDVTMEQKLKLVKQIRSRYNEDQYDLSNRELILYGKTSNRPTKRLAETPDQDAGIDNPISFLGIRVFLAVLLLAAVIVMDKNSMKVAGITADEIFQAISADYEEAIDRWAEALSMENAAREDSSADIDILDTF